MADKAIVKTIDMTQPADDLTRYDLNALVIYVGSTGRTAMVGVAPRIAWTVAASNVMPTLMSAITADAAGNGFTVAISDVFHPAWSRG